MPIYEYRCENDHRFEAFQRMVDDALDKCEVCGAPAQRVLSAPAVHFKGSGFYTTDYARKGKKPGGDGGGEKASEKKSDSNSSSDSSSSGNGSGGSKSESKSGSGSKD